MTQDTREAEGWLCTLRGVVAILLAGFVAIVAAIRGDDSWTPIVLVGGILAVGAGLLWYAFRR